jgi:hypothetical protein
MYAPGKFFSFSSTSVTSAILYRQMKHRHTAERQEYPFASLLLPAERHQNQNRFLSTFLLPPNPRSSCNASSRQRHAARPWPTNAEWTRTSPRLRYQTAPRSSRTGSTKRQRWTTLRGASGQPRALDWHKRPAPCIAGFQPQAWVMNHGGAGGQDQVRAVTAPGGELQASCF